MVFLVSKCPHCGVDQVAMQGAAPSEWAPHHSAAHGHRKLCSMLFGCPRCGRPIAAVVGHREQTNQASVAQTMQGHGCDLENLGLTIVWSWPPPPKPEIPDHLSDAAAHAFLQAESAFAVQGNEEAAAVMYRRAMERAFAHAFPDVEGSLFARINSLVAAGKISADIGAWAHVVREIGNEGAHDDKVSRPQLIAMRQFAFATLRYAITLPAEVRARRAAADEAVA